jgi:hypothetical protein
MNTDAGHHFNRRKRPRLAYGRFHRRLHDPHPKPSFLLDAVPCCLLPLIPPEAGSAAFDMGNFFSHACPGCRPKDGGLRVYRDSVDASQDAQDLTVATRDGVRFGQVVLSRRILDPRKAALLALVPPRPSKPFYRDALAKAGLHDKRLGEIEVELRLQYEKLDDLRPPKEVCIVKRFYGVVLLCLVSRTIGRLLVIIFLAMLG